MEKVVVVPAQYRSFSLSEAEAALVLGALAETIEEGRQPYASADLALLCRLHRRFTAVCGGGQQDYSFVSGQIVSARDRAQVVAAPSSMWDAGKARLVSKVAGEPRVVSFG